MLILRKYLFYSSQNLINITKCGLADSCKGALVNLQEIYKINLSSEEFRNFVKKEYEKLLLTRRQIPCHMRLEDWEKMFNLTSFNQRIDYYKYLFKRERAKENYKKKKNLVKNQLHLKEVNKDENVHTSMFIFVSDNSMLQFYNWKIISAIMFGMKIVFDLDFDSRMNEKEIKSLANQIRESHAFNKVYPEPAALYICNAKPSSPTLEVLKNNIPNLLSSSCLITVSNKSYIDLFLHHSIVYLSPDAPEYLEVIDDDAIYIIGGIVDMHDSQPVSLAKAKKENLKTFKLPIDKYLKWGTGNKRLTVDQVFAILVERKSTGNWDKALQHVPKRKTNPSQKDLFKANKLPQEKLGVF